MYQLFVSRLATSTTSSAITVIILVEILVLILVLGISITELRCQHHLLSDFSRILIGRAWCRTRGRGNADSSVSERLRLMTWILFLQSHTLSGTPCSKEEVKKYYYLQCEK